MLLDFRIMLAASLTAILLLVGGFALVAALRAPPGKPAVAIPNGHGEITGSVAGRGEKSQSLTDEDKTAQPIQPAAAPAQIAPEPARTANVEKPEKAQNGKGADEEKRARPRVAAKPRPRVYAPRQEAGSNFKNNNPFAFPFFAPAPQSSQ